MFPVAQQPPQIFRFSGPEVVAAEPLKFAVDRLGNVPGMPDGIIQLPPDRVRRELGTDDSVQFPVPGIEPLLKHGEFRAEPVALRNRPVDLLPRQCRRTMLVPGLPSIATVPFGVPRLCLISVIHRAQIHRRSGKSVGTSRRESGGRFRTARKREVG